jgi:glutamate dehydrogenase/leucine dehydrogenase
VGGANDQLATAEDANRLAKRQILFAPDIVVSIGGFMAVVGQEDRGWSREYAEEQVVKCVRSTLREVFQLSTARGVSPDECARAIARRRLESKNAAGIN